MMKRWSFIPMVVLVLVGVYIGLRSQNLPIAYDKSHVDKLTSLEGYNASYIQVYEGKDPSITLYNPAGWESEPGDFCKIQIKLANNKIFALENVDSWIKVLEPNKDLAYAVVDELNMPQNSQHIAAYPYFIKLATGSEACILMLFGYPYGCGLPLLTLIYVNQDKAEVIFNKKAELAEIAETAKGVYRLVGWLGNGNPFEILIEEGKLSFRRLPFEKVYENQFPSFVLYDCIGWGCNKQPGDFTRIKPTEGEHVVADNHSGFWRKIDSSIKTPAKSQRIKRCPYFIMLDRAIEGHSTLVLCKFNYNGEPADYLNLVNISSSHIELPRFVWKFKLKEIAETEQGYRLIGTTVTEQGEEQYCEHRIEDGAIVD